MKLKGFTRNILYTLNQPEKLRIAMRLLLRRNDLWIREFSGEIDYLRTSVSRWLNGHRRVHQSQALAICSFFNITIAQLAHLIENPTYIEEIAPRRFNIDQIKTPEKRFVIYSSKNGYLEYVRKSEDGAYHLDTRKVYEAAIFAEQEALNFIKLAPKKFILRMEIIVEKMLPVEVQ